MAFMTGRVFLVALGALLAAPAAFAQDVQFRADAAEMRPLTPAEQQAVATAAKWQPATVPLAAPGATGAANLTDAQGRSLASVSVTWVGLEPPSKPPTTGKGLFEWRKQRGLSIEQLAQATGLTTAVLTRAEAAPAAALASRVTAALQKAFGATSRATFEVKADNKSFCALSVPAEIRVTGEPQGVIIDRATWSSWSAAPVSGQSSGPSHHTVDYKRPKAVPLELVMAAGPALSQCRTPQVRQAAAPAATASRARRAEDKKAEEAKKPASRPTPAARAGSAAAEPEGGGLSLYAIGGIVAAGGAYAVLARSPADPVDPPSIAPFTFGPDNRPVSVQGTVVVTQPSVRFELRDNGQVDGDIVTFVVNGQALASNVRLTASTLTLSATLQPGNNFALLYINSEGTEPPNTTSVVIVDGATRQFLTPFSGSLQSSPAFNVIVRP